MVKHEYPGEVEVETTQDFVMQSLVDVVQLRLVITQLNNLIDVVIKRESLWRRP